MKKDSHTIETKDSIRRKLSAYSKRTAFTLIFTLLFSFVIGFTIVCYSFRNIGYSYWFSMSILVIWWIFGILLGISAIVTLVFFILFIIESKKLAQLNSEYSSRLNYSVPLVILGLILCINSFFFIHLRAFDPYFLYPRILSLIGLICLSFGLYTVYKFFVSIKSVKMKNENLLGSRFLYYSVFAYPIVALIDIIIRVIFKNTLSDKYCSPYICNRYASDQFYIASNSWNFILIFMIANFVTIAIIGLFKVSKYIHELDDSIEEEFRKKPEVSLMSKLSKNIRFSAYSLSFTILSLVLLHSLYGDFIWDVPISFNDSISYMFGAQFIFQAVISTIFFSIFFIRFILDLRKLSSLNTELSKLTKRSSLSLIFGLILLFTGYITGLFEYHENAIYYISNSIKLLSFLLLFFGYLIINLIFRRLKKEEIYSGRLYGSSLLSYIFLLFSFIIIVDTIIRTYISSVFTEIVCSSGGFCRKSYTAKYNELLGINNTCILILVAILIVSFSFSMYLLSKEFKRITLKKIQIQKIMKD